MQQLSGVDVSFLNMETPSTFGHVASITVFDVEHAPPGGAGVEATKRVILERIDRLAPFRRRLVQVPFGLDLPYWIEDPDFDIDFHVRGHAVPTPGTAEQLAEVVSRIHARPLDRSRPLWELYVIEGVDGGRKIAQLTKVHHATIDGASGALMLAAILDTEPAVAHAEPAAWSPDELPTVQELLKRTLAQYVRNPEKFIRLSVRSMRELGASTRSVGIKTMAEMLAMPMPGPLGNFVRQRLRNSPNEVDDPPALPGTPAPRTPWNATITPHRRFAYTTIPLEDAKAVRRAVGCTFNDVVMALCSTTLRNYLLEKDALPAEPLIAAVPVSVRTGNETDMYQNRVSMLLADLATNEPDPLARLRRVQQSMTKAKTQFAAIPADTLQDFTQFAPPAIAARAMRMYSRLRIADRAAPPFNLIISNVPGPSYSLYSAGARLEHFYPISALTDGQGLNMTVQSYNGNLDFGFVACRELVPDVWRLTELLQAAMAELLTAVGATGGEAQPATTQQPQPAKRPAKKRAAKKPAAKRRAAKKAATKKRARSTGTAAKKAPAAKRPAKKAGAPPTKTAGKRASTAKKASGAKGSPA
ncbi:MAG: wax ester/triacylglycerol synthase family O-acyltransferase [Actinomycetota bacterium]|nr:wax ester/triacylglycerol synthase family O-acyltransferase [Actinomycetota bacterium]